MKSRTTDQEQTVVTRYTVRRIIDQLRTPFVQRLIILVLSVLLAMSMGATILLSLPPLGRAGASVPITSQPSHAPSPLSAVGRIIRASHPLGSASHTIPVQDGVTTKERRLS